MTEKKAGTLGSTSPYSRGDSDRYYGRAYNPHKFEDGLPVNELTIAEQLEYERGWNENPSGEKDWE